MAVTLNFWPVRLQRSADVTGGPAVLDCSGGGPRCTVALPRAAESGVQSVACSCGAFAAIGLLGRDGDPRTVLLPCRLGTPKIARVPIDLPRRSRRTLL